MKYAHYGEPTTCIKLINFHKKSRQNLRQQICRKVLFTSIQLDLDQNQGWLGCVGTKWCDEFGITNFSLALSGWATSFEFRSHRVNNRLWSWRIQHPLATKRLRVKLNEIHIMRARALYWQFCWDLGPYKPSPTDTTDNCWQGVGHTGIRNYLLTAEEKV